MPDQETRILVVDDEPAMREVLEMRLQDWGYRVRTASDASEGRQLVDSFAPHLILADVVMPEVSGLDFLRELMRGNAQRPVILITAQGSIDMAVEAMKDGARDFLTKPIDYDKLRAVLDAAGEELATRRRADGLVARLEKGAGLGGLVGDSKPMRAVFALIRDLSRSDAAVLITGQSGTGKELVARAIHDLGARAERPFVAVNSAAIPENLIESEIFGHEKGAFTGAAAVHTGCFEQAHTGTLFLDEIAEMPAALQPKLLRVLEDGRVRRLGGTREFAFDVRILAATNQEPRRALDDGRLREDLYYRLNVFTVALPPLRERQGDIPLLAQHFLKAFRKKHQSAARGLRDETLERMQAYSWPGNVRELRNVLERAVVLARDGWIEPSHLPPYLLNPAEDRGARVVLPAGATAAEAEKELILQTLELTGNNKAEAARRLGLDVKTIRNKLKSYGIT